MTHNEQLAVINKLDEEGKRYRHLRDFGWTATELSRRCFYTKAELLQAVEEEIERNGYRSFKFFCLGGLPKDEPIPRWILLWVDETRTLSPSLDPGGE